MQHLRNTVLRLKLIRIMKQRKVMELLILALLLTD